jgi:phospholipase/carboxylesterase
MITYTQTLNSESIEVTPNIPAKGSVIWLHGLGADGHDFTSIVAQLNLPLRFIFPHAPLRPVTINNGYVMRAWFDIYSMQIDQRIDVAGIADSVKRVEQLIQDEQNKNISAERIIIGGFSQGAVIALTAGLGYSKKLGGIIALSGYLPNATEVLLKKSDARKSDSNHFRKK